MSTRSDCYCEGVVVGKRIARGRRSLGMQQVDLAAAMGSDYDRSTLAHVETGRRGISVERIIDCALALGVSSDWLLGLTEDPTPADDLSRRLAECTGVPPEQL